MPFAAEIAFFSYPEKNKKGSGCLSNHSEDLRNIELLAHTELLWQNTQLPSNALMFDLRENQFYLPSASERICQLYKDNIRH